MSRAPGDQGPAPRLPRVAFSRMRAGAQTLTREAAQRSVGELRAGQEGLARLVAQLEAGNEGLAGDDVFAGLQEVRYLHPLTEPAVVPVGVCL